MISKKYTLGVIAVLVMAACAVFGLTRPKGSSDWSDYIPFGQSSSISAKNMIPTKYTAKVIQSLAYDDNKIGSSTGMYILSALLANGVNGRAQEELLKAMETQDLSKVNEIVQAQMSQQSSRVEMATSAWSEYFLSSYKEAIRKLYADDKDSTDLSLINAWVSEKTHGLIRELSIDVPSGKYVKYVLVNAIYFRDKWKDPFETNDTYDERFYSFGEKRSSWGDMVDMMHKKDMYLPYYEDEILQAIQLPYKTGDKMTILLPKIPFDRFIQNFKAEYLELPYERKDISEVAIPKFRIETERGLMDLFRKWGIETILTKEGYDYNQMVKRLESDGDNKLVGFATQKAKIEVEENGTRAVVVTYAGGFGDTLAEEEPKEIIFRADHPFVFIINDGLFVGTYAKAARY